MTDQAGSGNKPAAGLLKVVCLGVGLPAALIARHFADCGADVVRVTPNAGDPFAEAYPAYPLWLGNVPVLGRAELDQALADADICIIGGEDHPDLERAFDGAALLKRYPQLIVTDLTAYAAGTEGTGPAVDLLVQARTGAVFEQSAHRPIAAGLPLASYGATLQGCVATWAALIERERSGLGQVVHVSLAGGLAMFWAPFWMHATRPDAGFSSITPRDVRPLILRCKDGRYLQITMGVPGAKVGIRKALGMPPADEGDDRGIPRGDRGPEQFFGDVALYDTYASNFALCELLEAMRTNGVPAEAVAPPGECWRDPQIAALGAIKSDASGWSHVAHPLHFMSPSHPPPCDEGRAENPSGWAESGRSAPLAGLKVLDFGVFVAGPYASKLLSDYGADVIHIEPPTGRATLSGERTIIAANFGKRSVCIDAKSNEGAAILKRLCAGADVVTHNFRVGVAERLGLD